MHWPFGYVMVWVGILSVIIIMIGWNRLFSRDIILRKEAEDELKKAYLELEERNKDLTDNLKYAIRIQTSLLPTEKYIDKSLKKLEKDGSDSKPN